MSASSSRDAALCGVADEEFSDDTMGDVAKAGVRATADEMEGAREKFSAPVGCSAAGAVDSRGNALCSAIALLISLRFS
jgi:hypothetical protein